MGINTESRMEIRLSPEEKRLWTECARKRGLTLSDWVRTMLTNVAKEIRKREQSTPTE